ncbi:MAG: ABC transporter permease [Agathobacter sp.]
MKSDLLTIIKKELTRFFGDKRMLMTALMPGLIIYAMYSVMGEGFSSMNNVEDGYNYKIQVVDMPQALVSLKEMEGLEITEITSADIEDTKNLVKEGEQDLLVVFPADFDEQLLTYDVTTATTPAPNVEIYYNSAETASGEAYSVITAVLDQLENSLANKFDICAGEKDYDMATEEDISMMIVSMILPMLVMTFIFTGCMSASAESIAGEKERGTIATLLVTPMNRRDLALGKLISLSIIGLLSGCSSFIGTMLSLPKLMGGSEMDSLKLSYEVKDYAVLLAVILTTTLVIVGLISIISAFAKSVKEASTYCAPLMMVTMMLSFSTMLGVATADQWYLYLIPLYNTVQCMGGIFNMDYSMMPIIVTIASNVVYAGGLVLVLTKMFNSERIMYT